MKISELKRVTFCILNLFPAHVYFINITYIIDFSEKYVYGVKLVA